MDNDLNLGAVSEAIPANANECCELAFEINDGSSSFAKACEKRTELDWNENEETCLGTDKAYLNDLTLVTQADYITNTEECCAIAVDRNDPLDLFASACNSQVNVVVQSYAENPYLGFVPSRCQGTTLKLDNNDEPWGNELLD